MVNLSDDATVTNLDFIRAERTFWKLFPMTVSNMLGHLRKRNKRKKKRVEWKQLIDSPLSCPHNLWSRTMATLPQSDSVMGLFLLSTVTLCMLRKGDWINDKFLCNLLLFFLKCKNKTELKTELNTYALPFLQNHACYSLRLFFDVTCCFFSEWTGTVRYVPRSVCI